MSAQEIHEIMAYIGRLDPGVRARMVGASDAEISALEAISGVELCASHRTWLQYLGNTPFNALEPLFYDYSLSIADAQEFYARIGPKRTAMLGRAAFLFHHEIDEMLYTIQPDDPEEDPPLTDIPFGDDGFPVPYDRLLYASFAAWLLDQAFYSLFVFRQDNQFSVDFLRAAATATDDELRADIAEVVTRLGFTKAPQSRGSSLLYERADLGVRFGKTYSSSPFGIGIAGADEKETRIIVELLHDRYGGSVTRYPKRSDE